MDAIVQTVSITQLCNAAKQTIEGSSEPHPYTTHPYKNSSDLRNICLEHESSAWVSGWLIHEEVQMSDGQTERMMFRSNWIDEQPVSHTNYGVGGAR